MTESKVKRRQFLKYAAAAAIGVAVVGAGGYYYTQSTAPQPKVLRVNLDPGSWGDYHKQSFMDKFQKDYPNVQVRVDSGTEAESIVKFISEYNQTGKTSDDLRPATSLGVTKAFMAGIADTDAMTPQTIPNMKDIIPAFQPWPWFPTRIYMPFGLTYNANEVNPPPTSYDDLWNPKWKGRIAYPDWGWVGESFFWYTNWLYGGTPDNVDAGISKVRSLIKDNQAKLIRTTDMGIQLFQDKEIVMAPFWLGRTNEMIGRGHPVNCIFPKGWMSLVGDWFILKSGGGVTDIAQKFINYALDPQAEVTFAKLSGYPPASQKASDLLTQTDPTLAKKTLVPSEAFDRMGKVDFTQTMKTASVALDRWNKEVVG